MKQALARVETELTKKQLADVMRQQEEDQLTHMSMLFASSKEEKAKAFVQLTTANVRVATLTQELKKQVGAMQESERELQKLREEDHRGDGCTAKAASR